MKNCYKMNYVVMIIFVLLSWETFSQMELHIETYGGEPVPGARFEAVSLADSSQVKQIADAGGSIYLEQTGQYWVKVQAYGCIPFEDTIIIEHGMIIKIEELQLIREVVVTAQNKATSVENAVQKITVISAEQIRNSGANNLSDILNYQTGIRLSQDNVLGSSMDLGGISGQNVKVLVDGVPVIGRMNGNIDLSQINLNNVERIEVVEGPLSVNYGTNALAGTVNIITKKKSREGVSLELTPYYETIGNYNLTGNIAWRKKKHVVLIDGGRNFFDGWTSGDPFVQLPRVTRADTNRVKTWKPKEQYFGGVRYSYISPEWRYSLFGKCFNETILNRGKPTAPYYETAFDDYYHSRRLDAGLTDEHTFKHSKLNLLLAYNYYNRTKNTYLKNLTTLDEVLSATTGAQDTSRFDQITARLIYSGKLRQRITYQLGADLNHSTGWGRRIEDGKQDIGDFAGFATFDWKVFDSLTLKPGVRYAYNTAYKAPLVPSLNVLYRVKKLSFRASVARGFRAPDLKELYLDFVDINHNITGNPNLKAEESWNYAFYVNRMQLTSKGALLKLEYGAYYNAIDNLITLGNTDAIAAYTYINIGTYSTIGQQFSVNYRSKRWNANLNATWIGRYNPDSETIDVERYTYSPELGIRMSYDIVRNRLKANVFYKFNGALQSFSVDETGTVQTSLQSSYSIVDASVTAHLMKKKQFTLTFGGKNLLNVKQVSISGQAQSGAHTSSSAFNAGRGVSLFLSLRYRIEFKNMKDEK